MQKMVTFTLIVFMKIEPAVYVTLSVLLMYGTNCLSQLILDRYLCSCAVSAVWIYLATCIYNFTFSMYYVYNGFMSLILLHIVGLLLMHSMPCCLVILCKQSRTGKLATLIIFPWLNILCCSIVTSCFVTI